MHIKNSIIAILVILLSGSIAWIYFDSASEDEELEIIASTSVEYTPVSLVGAEYITCTYKQFTYTSLNGNTLNFNIPEREETPIVVNYSMFDDVASADYTNSENSTSTIALYKMRDDSEKYILLEDWDDAVTILHTIYKRNGTASYSSHMSVPGMPLQVTSQSTGSCVHGEKYEYN